MCCADLWCIRLFHVVCCVLLAPSEFAAGPGRCAGLLPTYPCCAVLCCNVLCCDGFCCSSYVTLLQVLDDVQDCYPPISDTEAESREWTFEMYSSCR
jgi:hypothetical protein